MMKKAKDLKETRKTNQNFFKYIQPTKATGFSNYPKIHTRSMMDLQSNIRYNQSARQVSNNNKQNHQMSVCNHSQQQQHQIKSNSLKKFLSLFGSNASNNPILNPGINNIRSSVGKQQKLSGRNTNRQVFTCNIKNMNVNVSNSKEKEGAENKSNLIIKNPKSSQNHSLVNQLKAQRQQLKRNLQNVIQQHNEKQKIYKQKLKVLQNQNNSLKKQLSMKAQQRLVSQQKWLLRERSLQKTIENLQKNLNKQRCRQHELIIQSLKKVINQQLRKIIELQKSKIQREQIEKLQERINKNMTIKHQNSIKQKAHFLQVKDVLSKVKDGAIKIVEDSFNQSALTSNNEGFEMIEEVQEHYQSSNEKSMGDGDSILEEVDKYLVQWRKRI